MVKLNYTVDPLHSTDADRHLASQWINDNLKGMWMCIYEGRNPLSPLYTFEFKHEADAFRDRFRGTNGNRISQP